MNKVLSLFVIILVASCNGTSDDNMESQNNESSDSIAQVKEPFKKLEFQSLDSLLISANLYEIDKQAPLIILCHQRGFNKFEYAGIAERLNGLGFNCLAIDQRCGGPIANQPNETWLRAIDANKPVDFLDAEQDIKAAINYGYSLYNNNVILLGSSYSSTLCVYEAISNDSVDAVIAFSPGNYFFYDGVKPDLTLLMKDFKKPFFLTAANNEMPYVRELVLSTPRSEKQVVFAPEGEGWHGARALWPNQEDGEEYWVALEKFLNQIK